MDTNLNVSVAVVNAGNDQLIKRKGLFWLTVLEVSVHGRLHCLGACGEAAAGKNHLVAGRKRQVPSLLWV